MRNKTPPHLLALDETTTILWVSTSHLRYRLGSHGRSGFPGATLRTFSDKNVGRRRRSWYYPAVRTVLRLVAAFAACAVSMPSFAGAADVELLGGTDTNFGASTYSYLGVGLDQPVAGSWSIRGRIVGSYLTFNFREAGDQVDAEAPAVKFLVGPKYQITESTSVTVFAGGQIKETEFDRPHDKHRNDNGAVVAAELYSEFLPKTTGLVLYEYTAPEHFHWGRIALTRELFSLGTAGRTGFGIGAEVAAMGSRDFEAQRGGLLLQVRDTPLHLQLQLTVGAENFRSTTDKDDRLRPYLGVNIYSRF